MVSKKQRSIGGELQSRITFKMGSSTLANYMGARNDKKNFIPFQKDPLVASSFHRNSLLKLKRVRILNSREWGDSQKVVAIEKFL